MHRVHGRDPGQSSWTTALLAVLLLFGTPLQAAATNETARNSALRIIEDAILVLSDAASHGLAEPVDDILILEAARDEVVLASWDQHRWDHEIRVFVSDALLAWSLDFTLGREKPSRDRREAYRKFIDNAIEAEAILEWYKSMMPQDPAYHRLRAAMIRFASVQHEWPAVGAGETLKPGDQGQRVLRLRQRLGLHTLPGDAADIFDAELQAVVANYQKAHGLTADGQVGPLTRQHLDVPAEQRLAQIHTNLERWRRSSFDNAGKQIRVNLPSYELEYRDGYAVSGRMRVVVGNKNNPTPILNDKIDYLVFSPYWFVPNRIVRQEILPKINRDASYLSRMNLDVLPRAGYQPVPAGSWNETQLRNNEFYLRQRPGPENSLGRLKFMFPNDEQIYLHDTAAPALFAHSRRAYSHGCVRVENASLLAEWLLDEQPEWDAAAISDAMNRQKPKRVYLDKSIPIVTTYFTALAQDSGEISFYEDIYKHDADSDAAFASTYIPHRQLNSKDIPRFANN